MNRSLQQKNTRYLLIWLPFVLLAGSLFFYVMLLKHANHMQSKQLELKQDNIWNAFAADPLHFPLQIRGEYTLAEGGSSGSGLSEGLRDTVIDYGGTRGKVAFGLITKQYSLDGRFYLLTTYSSSKEIGHLVVKVFIAEAFILLLLLGSIIVLNRRSSGLLWQPFYHTLERLKTFDIKRNGSFPLPGSSGTLEFDQLNQAVTDMIADVQKAYSSQKQFTENAAHELQTPLAIIRSKLDLAINNPGLTEEMAALLADITEANERMSQLNKNLLLLTRIENNQFPEQGEVNLSAMLERLCAHYRTYYEEDLPATRLSVEPAVTITGNHALAEVLVSNLLKNAIVHNIPGGFIAIRLELHALTIENTGYPVGGTDLLFERFKKGREEGKTTGLGLALVKQICQVLGFGLQYTYEAELHRVRILFPVEGAR